MGFKPTACFGLGFFSFLGAIFYLISAYMVHNRNLVFISHKAGMDMFTSTEEEFHEKMMAMLITAGVSRIKRVYNFSFRLWLVQCFCAALAVVAWKRVREDKWILREWKMKEGRELLSQVMQVQEALIEEKEKCLCMLRYLKVMNEKISLTCRCANTFLIY